MCVTIKLLYVQYFQGVMIIEDSVLDQSFGWAVVLFNGNANYVAQYPIPAAYKAYPLVHDACNLLFHCTVHTHVHTHY